MSFRNLVPSFAFLLVLSSSLVACGGTDETVVDRTAPGPTMRPGEQCLSCHRAGGQAATRIWTAAGTVFASETSAADEGVAGAVIEITDKTGKTEKLTTNDVGNFYTRVPLEKPLKMRITYQGKSADMPIALDAEGACNACHSFPDAIGGAKGRIRVPK
jgi:hypothetical protein